MKGMKKAPFERFLRENGDRIFGYAFYFLRNREDAEDVTQEVFMKLWQHWPTINHKGRVPFAMRVAHNKCIDVTRRRQTSGAHMRASAWLDLQSIPAKRDASVDPELHTEFTEKQKALLSAIQTLPEKTRSMLLMHYFQGLKLEAIGEVFDMKVGTVKVTIHRARVLLRRTLGTEFREGGRTYSDDKVMQ
jgi:RNA polymerase sigma-70 factor (ECF subfamily)